ncbi:hypothetical protein H4W31_005117 [Plantactinospora soyae]|uniref:Uncharacterized protein n=1 Tax=Plantactinospora soyae TaxID=1544732 RepID=A0A927R7I9_9ACTN|nr:hypothetical protein [Plantactinospora soyae]
MLLVSRPVGAGPLGQPSGRMHKTRAHGYASVVPA